MKSDKRVKKLQQIEKIEAEEEMLIEEIDAADTLVEEESEEIIPSVKKFSQDPWQNVQRKALADRKAATGKKLSPEKLISSLQHLNLQTVHSRITAGRALKFPKISAKRTPLKKRRAQQIDTLNTGIGQILKNILTDYNSIEFFSKVS